MPVRWRMLVECALSLPALVAIGGCAGQKPTPTAFNVAAPPNVGMPANVASPANVSLPPCATAPLPAGPPPSYGSSPIQTVAANLSSTSPVVKLAGGSEDVPRPMPAPPSLQPRERQGNPIDLATALRLADGGNLQVAYAREQVRQALARVDRADVLWLPSIRGGVGFNHHDGGIQTVAGQQIDTSRGAAYFGLGASGYGNGSPNVPGVYANFALADAIFLPLAAQQFAGARQQAAAAVENDTLLRVALAYLELLRAEQELAIAEETRSLSQQLADLTANFAKAGEGLLADADRMRTELNVRIDDVERAHESTAVASARLAQLLRLDPVTPLDPIEPTAAAIEMTPTDCSLRQLVAEGLANRPELAEGRLLAGEAFARLRREEAAPLLPNVLVGLSEGDFAAGQGTPFANLQGRFDFDAIAYWELRNFGFGDRAARNEVRSQVEQAQIRQSDVADQIAREIVEAYAETQSRRREIETARQGIQSAIDSHRRNLDRIRAAKGLPIEALQSVQALAQSRREYLRAVIDYDSAQFSLYRAIGAPVLKLAQQPPQAPAPAAK